MKPAPDYCGRCGAKLTEQASVVGYDNHTGDPITQMVRWCSVGYRGGDDRLKRTADHEYWSESPNGEWWRDGDEDTLP